MYPENPSTMLQVEREPKEAVDTGAKEQPQFHGFYSRNAARGRPGATADRSKVLGGGRQGAAVEEKEIVERRGGKGAR